MAIACCTIIGSRAATIGLHNSQLPQEHDIEWQTKSNYTKRHNRIAAQAEEEVEEEEREQMEPQKAHGRASWALKSPRCDEATSGLNESVSKMRWMQQQGNCNWLRLGLG